MKIRPARSLQGVISLPGDKSISHRAAIIAALATGPSNITNFSTSRDCSSTLLCLETLGSEIERRGSDLRIEGRGQKCFRQPEVTLDCGNSGSTIRLLAGVLSAQDLTTTLTGDDSLQSRPMQRVIEPLTEMGARITSQNGKPPLTIKGSRQLQPIRYETPVASAQVKSAILLAALSTSGRTEVLEIPTRDHTERVLQWFGVPVESTKIADRKSLISLTGEVNFDGRDFVVPGDVSSAAYFIAAAALMPGSNIEIADVGLNPARTGFLRTIQNLGVKVEILDLRARCNEPVGTLRLIDTRSDDQATERHLLTGALIPGLIDELPLLAVVGTQLQGGLEIRDAAELRVKESDRIRSTVTNLKLMGAEVEEYQDGMRIAGPTPLRGAVLNSYGDHRIAMAFAVGALIATGESEIVDAEYAAVSFPEFFDMIDSLAKR